jgi:acetyl esterase/lipase
MKCLPVYIFALCMNLLLNNAISQQFFTIWPEGKKPNFNGKIVTDSFFNERIWRVETPGIYAFPVAKSENTGTAVLICPGGGYERLSYIYNGFNLAHWFNSKGINVFVLKYRLPHQQDLINKQEAALQDAQRAIKYILSNTERWNLNKQKLGVMGVSAGGHLAAMLGNQADDISKIGDSLDVISFRPKFMLLLSPVITMGKFAHPGSLKRFLGSDTSFQMINKYSVEKNVNAQTPPAFIVHAQNDSTVNVRNAVLLYSALIEKNILASIHIFPQGGHGIKLFDNPGSTELWLPLLELWLKEMGFLIPLKK